jgi:hypothetical protein
MTTPAHLAHVHLHEYTENVPRLHVEHRDGTCGALPAKAFRTRYTHGCRRLAGHDGAHSAEERSAERADIRDAARGAR